MPMLRSQGGVPVMSLPSTSNCPELCRLKPAISRSSVDLPDPDGPHTTSTSPRATDRLIMFVLALSHGARAADTQVQPAQAAAQAEANQEIDDGQDAEHLQRLGQHQVVDLVGREGQFVDADDIAQRRLLDGRHELAGHAGQHPTPSERDASIWPRGTASMPDRITSDRYALS
ncbi:hypothetical protein G6F24_015250 [Rhizopus arrhizus]|nr:hypothetical protein G6F24_015250 [Rhizopus arrhizus]